MRNEQLRLWDRGHLTKRIEGWAAGGGRVGLTYAYPLLDRRIVEFALGLPPEMFFKNGWKRYLFRHAMAGMLPDDIRWNPSKREASLNADRERLGKESPDVVRPMIEEMLADSRDYQVLDIDRARRAMEARQRGDLEHDKHAGVAGALMVEMLVNPDLERDAEERLCRLRETVSPRKAVVP